MSQTFITEVEKIHINEQNEVDEILGHPPSWLLRWGLSLVFVATLLFGMLSWVIKYPDVIPASVQILTENPAIRLIPIVSGKVSALLVKDLEVVQKNKLLAIIESPTDYHDIIKLEHFLDTLRIIDYKDYLEVPIPTSQLILGDIQNLYAGLIQKLKDYQHFLQKRNFLDKILIFENQIEHVLSVNESIKRQQKTLTKEIGIAENNWLRNKILRQEGVISDLELEQMETNYLQYQRQLDNFDTQIYNNKIQIEQIQLQLLELRQNRIDGLSTRELIINENLQTLQSQIENWKKSYLIKSPIEGKVNFTKVWSTNQFINRGEVLVTIVPLEGAGKKIAKTMLPVDNSGKVKVSQIVNISFNDYPYQEYGVIKSSVLTKGLIPITTVEQGSHKFYSVDLFIPDTLKTTYNKIIPFTQEMEGKASIITEDRRIIHRLFDRVWNVLKNT